MSSYFGRNIHLQIFGESHGAVIGATVDGLPAGFEPDIAALEVFMAKRAPSGSAASTSRREKDEIEFVSGMTDGRLNGAPLTMLIRNMDARRGDYPDEAHIPRPGHADLTSIVKYGGYNDPSGGGHFSGRLTAPLCAAGGIMIQLLAREGIHVAAHILSVGGIEDKAFDPVSPEINRLHGLYLDSVAGEKIEKLIEEIRTAGDSIGGVIEAAVTGLPAGIGEPMFEGLENVISQAVFAIPAVKGIEFGEGFRAADMLGSEFNDAFVIKNGAVMTETNRHGGILGGISSGMPIVFRAAVKPTPTIAVEQRTVDTDTMKETTVIKRGRHDACIVPRAVPCIEATAAIAVYDLLRGPARHI